MARGRPKKTKPQKSKSESKKTQATPHNEPKVKFINERRTLGDLIPYEFNPRSMTKEQNARLEKSIKKYGLVEIPVINADNVIIAGHQRIRIALEKFGADYEIDVRVPTRLLTEDEFQWYLLASNAIDGDWIPEILRANFNDIVLEEIGLQDIVLDKEERNFLPASEDEQGALDKKKPVTCPHCGEEFEV